MAFLKILCEHPLFKVQQKMQLAEEQGKYFSKRCKKLKRIKLLIPNSRYFILQNRFLALNFKLVCLCMIDFSPKLSDVLPAYLPRKRLGMVALFTS